MEVLIITDDTGAKLPVYNKWKMRATHGIDIRKDPTIKSLLNEYKIYFPTDDIENESLYKKVLSAFIRPANLMFGGMFSEVRNFSQTLSSFIPTKIYFISGRYGLISENDKIIPYYYQLDTVSNIELADKKHGFVKKLRELSVNNQKILIFLLPKQYIEYLIKRNFFDNVTSNSRIIIVSITEFREYFSQFRNVTYLQRIGVARIGETNREAILKIVKPVK